MRENLQILSDEKLTLALESEKRWKEIEFVITLTLFAIRFTDFSH